jgi:hypothetical protein
VASENHSPVRRWIVGTCPKVTERRKACLAPGRERTTLLVSSPIDRASRSIGLTPFAGNGRGQRLFSGVAKATATRARAPAGGGRS